MFVDFDEGVKVILEKDKRYSREAYEFVREALEYTRVWMDRRGHVTGQELLEGIRKYALDQFGPMAKTVLNFWGVKACEDFGHIVFNLVDQKVLSKTPEDSLDDFRSGYDFEEMFDKPFKN
jgi:uncharacterized repeat protein (TIGR04138 family)